MELRYMGGAPEKEIMHVFTETMEEMFHEDSRVIYIDADLMGSLKTSELWHKYPKNVFNTGIQEANMVGVAAGLYLAGFKPYIHSFSPFATRRVFDQVFLSVGYAQKSVRIIGSDAGIMATKNGGTHMCFEDVALMRTVPGSLVLEATDGVMFKAFLKATKDRPGVTYIKTARRGLPDIYMPDEQFEEGKGKVLREGSDVTLIAAGIMVGTCLDAAKLLADEGISARVIDIVTIKPIDEALVIESAQKTGAIVTAENANVIGGLGSAVCDVLSGKYPTKVEKVGIQDLYGCVGDEAFLREKYGLTKENIVSKVKGLLNR
ncbi:MAG: transketolase family protein [Alphaproteobacteria bacterium]|nr:transketolase family protein [Alphaproteobacteria bacterium]